MKKYLIILSALFLIISCSSDDDGCTCRGQYDFIDSNGELGMFLADNVDCATGERPSSPIQDNSIFRGCEN